MMEDWLMSWALFIGVPLVISLLFLIYASKHGRAEDWE